MAMPIIKRMLVTLLPRTFPIDMEACFCNAAMNETANSGKEVPKATIVKPIACSLMPNFAANPAAPSTNKSLPATRANPPKRSKKMLVHFHEVVWI